MGSGPAGDPICSLRGECGDVLTTRKGKGAYVSINFESRIHSVLESLHQSRDCSRYCADIAYFVYHLSQRLI